MIIDYSQFFRVYKKDTNGFTLNESVSFSPYYGSIIRVVQDRIILAGISENVTFYLYNGTHYEFEKVFTTPEPSIMYLEVDENLQRILFGGTWKTTFIYNL